MGAAGGQQEHVQSCSEYTLSTWEPSNSLEMSLGRAALVVLAASSPGSFQVLV